MERHGRAGPLILAGIGNGISLINGLIYSGCALSTIDRYQNWVLGYLFIGVILVIKCKTILAL